MHYTFCNNNNNNPPARVTVREQKLNILLEWPNANQVCSNILPPYTTEQFHKLIASNRYTVESGY